MLHFSYLFFLVQLYVEGIFAILGLVFVATALASIWDKGVAFRSRRRRRCGQQDLHFASFVSFTNSGHTTLDLSIRVPVHTPVASYTCGLD